MDDLVGSLLLTDMKRAFTAQKDLADRAVAQLSDQDVFRALDDESNSIAVIMKHVGGNLRSRWTDFLTTDGEKPDRDRDGEFEVAAPSRIEITKLWDLGFLTLSMTLETLQPEDLKRTVHIRGEPLSAVQALNRSLAHTAQHVGQIILLAKHWRGAQWQTLSIARTRRDAMPTQQ